MEFRELSDGEWEFIRPLLPPKARTGRPRAEDRKAINDILYVFITSIKEWSLTMNMKLIL